MRLFIQTKLENRLALITSLRIPYSARGEVNTVLVDGIPFSCVGLIAMIGLNGMLCSYLWKMSAASWCNVTHLMVVYGVHAISYRCCNALAVPRVIRDDTIPHSLAVPTFKARSASQQQGMRVLA